MISQNLIGPEAYLSVFFGSIIGPKLTTDG